MKTPKQERSRASLERMLGVGREMLEHGELDLNIVDIARRADCSVGSFYARFEGKSAFLHQLHREMLEAWAQTMDPLSPDAYRGVPLKHVVALYLEQVSDWASRHGEALDRFRELGRAEVQFRQRQELARTQAQKALERCLEARGVADAEARAAWYLHLVWGVLVLAAEESNETVVDRLATLIVDDAAAEPPS